MSEHESRLFADIKAAEAVLGKGLVRISPEPRTVVAMERGTRTHPDGVVEDYERLDFA